MMKSVVLIALLAIATFPEAWAGGESSAGGADDYRIVPAFFRNYDSKLTPVKACLEVSPGFGFDTATLKGMVEDAFAKWSTYLEDKRLNIVPSNLMIQTTLDLKVGCQGGENLRVLFGSDDPEVTSYKTLYAKPFGFAQLTQPGNYPNYPLVEARGFIWIAPPGSIDPQKGVPAWGASTRDALAGLVLHEMGHVFGNGHVDGTVMTEKIGQLLENDTAPVQTGRYVDLYSKIDSVIELVPCMECHLSYSAAETFDPIQIPGAPDSSDWVRTFKLLVGKDPVAPFAIRYERLGSPAGSGRITLIDALETYHFDVRIETYISERQDSTPLFSGQGGVDFYSFGVSYFGKIQPLVGPEFAVAVNYNMDGKKAAIIPLGGQFYTRPLFVSAP